LVIAAAATTGWVMLSKASAQEDFIAYCKGQGIEFDAKNIYANSELGTADIMEKYHETMNTQFNKYIKQMMAAESAAAKTGEIDENGQPPEIDPATNAPKDCDEKNYSTYCVGQKLLTDPAFGYMSYRKSLDCRRSLVFDTKADQKGYSDYLESALSGGVASQGNIKKDKVAEPVYQIQKALEVSAKLEAITREKVAAKEALDQTLSAYNELRVAWPMHKEYMTIYASLLKYRDKLVEVRHQVESFPSKFIDATTTKCT
jgi:hypothetical protein